MGLDNYALENYLEGHSIAGKLARIEKLDIDLDKYKFLEPVLIGIGGLYGAGKDVVADHLVAQHDFVKLGMSDALADSLYALNPIIPQGATHEWPDAAAFVNYQSLVDRVGYVEAKKNPEVRRLLQVLGTEVGRNIIGDNTWVDIMKRRVTEARNAGLSVIVTGIRFPNELEAIRSLGGALWWVHRPESEGNALSSHASEQSVRPEDFDNALWNTGTIEDLQNIASGLL